MIIDQRIQQLFHDLIAYENAKISMGQEDVFVRILDNANKISLSTRVYSGDKFIPQSVRRCVATNKSLAQSPLSTYFALDEEKYQVNLNYLGNMGSLNHFKFQQLLEDFHILAEEWRLILDEQDRNDLVHVHVK